MTDNWKLKKINAIFNRLKTMKNLQINFTKCMRDLYMENKKTLLREIKESQNKHRDTCVHGL